MMNEAGHLWNTVRLNKKLKIPKRFLALL